MIKLTVFIIVVLDELGFPNLISVSLLNDVHIIQIGNNGLIEHLEMLLLDLPLGRVHLVQQSLSLIIVLVERSSGAFELIQIYLPVLGVVYKLDELGCLLFRALVDLTK